MSTTTTTTTGITVWTAEEAEEQRSNIVAIAKTKGVDYSMLDEKLVKALERPVNPGCGEGYRKLVFAAVRELKKLIAYPPIDQTKLDALLAERAELLEEAGAAYQFILQRGSYYDRLLLESKRYFVRSEQLETLAKAIGFLRFGLKRLERDEDKPFSTTGDRKGPSAEQIKRRKERADQNRAMAKASGAGRKG